MRVWS